MYAQNQKDGNRSQLKVFGYKETKGSTKQDSQTLLRLSIPMERVS